MSVVAWRARLATVLVGALVLVGCTGEPTPREELAAALRATEETSVNFRVTAVADRGALDALEGGAADAAVFLEQAGLVGSRDPDGALRLAVTLGGDEPLIEVVSLPDGPLLLRTGLGDLLGVGRTDPAEQLDPALAELGVGEAGRRALAVSFAGGWLELTDVADVDAALAELFGDDGADAPGGAALTDLSALLDRVEVVDARDAGDVRRFDVQVDAAGLTGAAATDAPPLAGQVALRDGRVQEVRLELAPAAGAGPSDAGVVELVVTLTEVDAGTAVLRPEADAALTAAELLDLVDRLQQAGLAPAG